MLHVVVAVIRDKNNQILIAQRAIKKHQGGKWEFPGGKVEKDESAQQTLTRELDEELGIQISLISSLIQIHHDYSDFVVFLDVYEVREWQGKAYGKEGQPIRWVDIETLQHYAFPVANESILEALKQIK
jgi:8-oxo-dGTP diphosphatase